MLSPLVFGKGHEMVIWAPLLVVAGMEATSGLVLAWMAAVGE